MRRGRRGKTVLEELHPDPPEELVRIAKLWVADTSDVMLSVIWGAYDRMLANPKLRPAITRATDDLERGITRLLYFAIDDLLTGNEPFRLLPEAPEDESRKRPPARPRAYDIAFVMRVNPRIMWSLEAKVLATPSSLADYVKTVGDRYVSGDYAPFVSEGAMVGFLLTGSGNDVFKGVGKLLKVRLTVPTKWKMRAHRVSSHKRRLKHGKAYPVRFRCHHLVMEFT